MRRVISRSLWRKLMVTAVASIAFLLLYEVTMFDSGEASPQGIVDPTRPAAGSRHLFTATAYCKGSTTASGVRVRTGIAASDPALLPVGSVVNIASDTAKYNGVYTIMDTGPKVQGRILDIYMWSCHEALAFGRRPVEVTVLRLGWNPSASTPSLVERLFRRREAARNAPPATAGGGATDAAGANAGSEGAASEGAPVTDPVSATESSHDVPLDAPPLPAAVEAPLTPPVAPAGINPP